MPATPQQLLQAATYAFDTVAEGDPIDQVAYDLKTLDWFMKNKAPSKFTGGTFCVTNHGMMGIDRFCAIINPPNVAILAVGAALEQRLKDQRQERNVCELTSPSGDC